MFFPTQWKNEIFSFIDNGLNLAAEKNKALESRSLFSLAFLQKWKAQQSEKNFLATDLEKKLKIWFGDDDKAGEHIPASKINMPYEHCAEDIYQKRFSGSC